MGSVTMGGTTIAGGGDIRIGDPEKAPYIPYEGPKASPLMKKFCEQGNQEAREPINNVELKQLEVSTTDFVRDNEIFKNFSLRFKIEDKNKDGHFDREEIKNSKLRFVRPKVLELFLENGVLTLKAMKKLTDYHYATNVNNVITSQFKNESTPLPVYSSADLNITIEPDMLYDDILFKW